MRRVVDRISSDLLVKRPWRMAQQRLVVVEVVVGEGREEQDGEEKEEKEGDVEEEGDREGLAEVLPLVAVVTEEEEVVDVFELTDDDL
jgi:hypothetical protein